MEGMGMCGGVVGGGRGDGGMGDEGGLDDKRKIQTGQSFLFANRAPDKDSACSGADRGAISLPDSPHHSSSSSSIRPPASLTQQIVCEEQRRRRKEEVVLSVQHHGATNHQPATAINTAAITVKRTKLKQSDNEHIVSSQGHQLTHTHTPTHTCTHTHTGKHTVQWLRRK